MGGKISLESTPGVGTTVSFSLRFQKVKQADAEAASRDWTSREPDPMAKYSQENNGHESWGCIDLSTIPRDELRICIAVCFTSLRQILLSYSTNLS